MTFLLINDFMFWFFFTNLMHTLNAHFRPAMYSIYTTNYLSNRLHLFIQAELENIVKEEGVFFYIKNPPLKDMSYINCIHISEKSLCGYDNFDFSCYYISFLYVRLNLIISHIREFFENISMKLKSCFWSCWTSWAIKLSIDKTRNI